jgi:hypothetical protein
LSGGQLRAASDETGADRDRISPTEKVKAAHEAAASILQIYKNSLIYP